VVEAGAEPLLRGGAARARRQGGGGPPAARPGRARVGQGRAGGNDGELGAADQPAWARRLRARLGVPPGGSP
jgi:hypothetical protein